MENKTGHNHTTGTLILIRGIPGSGKSTLARKFVENCRIFPFTCEHFEADQYFMGKDGYKWDPIKVSAAHNNCFNNTLRAIRNKTDMVIVSNTFTTLKEMQPYIDLANDYNYDLRVIRVVGADYDDMSAPKLKRFASFKNEHSVPDETLEKMAERFTDYSGEEIWKN